MIPHYRRISFRRRRNPSLFEICKLSYDSVISTGKICPGKFWSGEILPLLHQYKPKQQDFSTTLVPRFGRNDTT